jgi:KipI family sensor histidine kinase inhibitor
MTIAAASPVKFLDAGDAAIVVEFGREIDPSLNAAVLALDAAIGAAAIPGVVETVPTYRSLMVQLDPLLVDRAAFVERVRMMIATLDVRGIAGRRWRVPVVYGGEFGIDLEDVARRHEITPQEVIRRHSAPVYRVYMIGFMPGFTYLGGLDMSIATPRRLDPRPKTPRGTISIGGIQALIANQEMPSGWHLLGRTPVRAFLAGREPAVLFAPGDEVVFEPIETRHWEALDRAGEKGEIIAEVVPA